MRDLQREQAVARIKGKEQEYSGASSRGLEEDVTTLEEETWGDTVEDWDPHFCSLGEVEGRLQEEPQAQVSTSHQFSKHYSWEALCQDCQSPQHCHPDPGTLVGQRGQQCLFWPSCSAGFEDVSTRGREGSRRAKEWSPVPTVHFYRLSLQGLWPEISGTPVMLTEAPLERTLLGELSAGNSIH